MKKFAKVMCTVLAVALLSVMFTGCVLTAEKATEKLKKKEYTVVSTQDSQLLRTAAGLVGLEDVVSGTIVVDGKTETVTIFYYKEKDDAKKAAENEEQFKQDMKGVMSALNIKESDDNPFVFKQSGNAVVMGTKNAVKVVA